MFFINQSQRFLCGIKPIFMKYKLIKRGNPLAPGAPKKFFAAPITIGKITIEQIADDLVLISSISIGDILSILRNLLDALPKYLLKGYSVQLGDLGTFRISFSSEGVDDPKEFVVAKIRNKKILFLPGPAFKKMLRDLVFEREKEKKD